MVYSTSNPPYMLLGGIATVQGRIWQYVSTDDAATVDGAGYITNAKDLGMKAGDFVFVIDSDDTNKLTSGHTVVSIDATTGAANLSNGITLGGGSNTD